MGESDPCSSALCRYPLLKDKDKRSACSNEWVHYYKEQLL